MTSGKLQGVRIAILVTDGFQVLQLFELRRALDRAGAATYIIAPRRSQVVGLTDDHAEIQIAVDIPLKSARAQDFHALLLPGGKEDAQRLSTNRRALHFITNFARTNKPIGATGESIDILSQAGVLRERRIVSRSQKNPDKTHAGYPNSSVVIIARRREDLSNFIDEMVDVLEALRAQSPDMRRIA